MVIFFTTVAVQGNFFNVYIGFLKIYYMKQKLRVLWEDLYLTIFAMPMIQCCQHNQLINISDEISKELDIIFNVKKSKCMFLKPRAFIIQM